MLTLFSYFFRLQAKRLFAIVLLVVLSSSLFIVLQSAILAVQQEIDEEIKPTIGGDISIESPTNWTPEQQDFIREIAQTYDVVVTQKISLSYSALQQKNDGTRATQSFTLIAVQGSYPLYGSLLSLDGSSIALGSAIHLTQRGRDFFGNQDSIVFEGQTVAIGPVVAESPDLGGFSFANDSLLMYVPWDVLQNTSLVQTGSRASYEYLIKTTNTSQTTSLVQVLQDSELFEDVDDYLSANQTITQRVQDFSLFLFLVMIVALVLIATVLFFMVEAFFFETSRERTILYLLGVQRKKLLLALLLFFAVVVVLSLIFSLVVSWLIVGAINATVDILTIDLTATTMVQGGMSALLIFCMALLLPLMQSYYQNPLTGINKTLHKTYTRSEIISIFLIQLLGLWLLGYIQTGTVRSALLIVVAFFALLAFLWLCKTLTIKLVAFFSSRYKQTNFVQFDAIRLLQRPGNMTAIMWLARSLTLVSTLTICTYALHMYAILSTSQQELPDAIVLNIPGDINESELFDGIGQGELYSRLGARIIAINNQPLEEFLGDSVSGEFTREFNTTINDLDDPIIQGSSSLLADQISLDESFANRLGVILGDMMTLSIVGREFTMQVVSLRQRPEALGAFFFIQLPREQFLQAPLTYFATIQSDLPDTQIRANMIERAGAGITFINAKELADTITSLTTRILSAITAFTIALAILSIIVLIVCVQRMRKLLSYTAQLYYYMGSPQTYMQRFFRYHIGAILATSTLTMLCLSLLLSLWLLSLSSFLDPSISIVGLIVGLVCLLLCLLIYAVRWRDT